MANNILQYEGQVWSTADLLIGAGIKQSDFPKFMMPFFALIMVESRLTKGLRIIGELGFNAYFLIKGILFILHIQAF